MSVRDFSERDIHLALDGELPGDERAAYQSWLEAHPEMKMKDFRFAADRAALQAAFAGVLEEPVPARLSRAVLGETARRGAAPWPRWWLGAAAAVLVMIGGLGGYAAGIAGRGRAGEAGIRLAEEAIAAHVVYVGEKRHAVEVPASDRERMQTWLSSRVGLKLVAPDLAADGFELMGGRLLPTQTGKAAMLLYDDSKGDRVSIFVTAEAQGGGSRGSYAQGGNGPRAVYWLEGGYGCAVVGSLPDRQLNAMADSAYKQLLPEDES